MKQRYAPKNVKQAKIPSEVLYSLAPTAADHELYSLVRAGLQEFLRYLETSSKGGNWIYLGHSDVTPAHGATTSLVSFLVWTYYSAQFLLVGA